MWGTGYLVFPTEPPLFLWLAKMLDLTLGPSGLLLLFAKAAGGLLKRSMVFFSSSSLGMELKGWSSPRMTPAWLSSSTMTVGGTKSRGTSGDSVSVSKRIGVSVWTGTFVLWSLAAFNLFARLDLTRGGRPSGLTSGPTKRMKVFLYILRFNN